MKPDPVFIGLGTIGLLYAAILLFRSLRRGERDRWPIALCWAIFSIGLLFRGFAPNLEVSRNAFIMPTDVREIEPAALVARERWMQTLSAVFTIIGAIGLAFFYRRILFRSRSPPALLEKE